MYTLKRATTTEGATLPEPVIVPTDPASTFTNSTAAGINRVVALSPDLLLVNNIGRNCELWHFDSAGGFRQQAVFNTTIFPGEDFPSIFDLDAHAAFLADGGATLLLCNHYGLVRCFDLAATEAGSLTVAATLSLPGDTERLLLAQGCLIASSPRGQYTPEPAEPGILISERLPRLADVRGREIALGYELGLRDWGMVTALATNAAQRLLAVGAAERIGVFALESREHGLRLGRCLWERRIPYLPQWTGFDGAARLIVAGYDATLDDPAGIDWDALGRGGFDAYSLGGDLLLRASLPDETAWGYGADPIAPSADYRHLYAIDRRAGLHAVSTLTGEGRQIYDGIDAPESLGIGHAETIHGSLFAGFSRGGYRLCRYGLSAS
ncbi:MAG: hypothetical protein GEU75_01950 [Dehalococcoidia bacterium]|nr:hypothetical protein [Dehalococcoidia bacterium]